MTMNPEVARIELAPAALLFRALGEPNRLLILQHLLTGEHTVRELTVHLNLAQSTVSAHLGCLSDCGLVSSRPDGRSTIWTLSAEAHLVSLLGAAERVLEASGYAIVLCPTCGVGTGSESDDSSLAAERI
ncbi:ArsR/SmtB family transcription factor [Agromyces sp. Marseille-Q5079]|uniref:ArsR/SmtB family transcription factor n=1 Tax=Agromyces sp. Marseille-Q5079 TaxID=3439059 RepID=UPI003D9CAA13